ncbi:hypothetical protein COEX109129_39865 [Corallococcus exiguus]
MRTGFTSPPGCRMPNSCVRMEASDVQWRVRVTRLLSCVVRRALEGLFWDRGREYRLCAAPRLVPEELVRE